MNESKSKAQLFIGDPYEMVLFVGFPLEEEEIAEAVLEDFFLKKGIRDILKVKNDKQISYRIVFSDAFYVYIFGYKIREYEILNKAHE